jgi:hypothetical protein
MWEPRRLTNLWASAACCRDSFTYFTVGLRERFTTRRLLPIIYCGLRCCCTTKVASCEYSLPHNVSRYYKADTISPGTNTSLTPHFGQNVPLAVPGTWGMSCVQVLQSATHSTAFISKTREPKTFGNLFWNRTNELNYV